MINLSRYPEAVDLLKNATSLSPHDSEVWREYGDALIASDNITGAEQSYRKSVQEDKKNYLSWQSLAKLESG